MTDGAIALESGSPPRGAIRVGPLWPSGQTWLRLLAVGAPILGALVSSEAGLLLTLFGGLIFLATFSHHLLGRLGLPIFCAVWIIALLGTTVVTARVFDSSTEPNATSAITPTTQTTTNRAPPTTTSDAPRSEAKPAAVPPPHPSDEAWNEVCDGWSPGRDAPDFAKEVIRRLYLGPQIAHADPPPGGRTGGCAGRTLTTPDHAHDFVYAIGSSADGVERSIAVVSKDRAVFPPGIFLAPAVRHIKKLIKRYGQVGGSKRRDAGRGDYYTVGISRYETALIVRATKTHGDEGVARDYVRLLPAAATLFLHAMRKHGTWLYAIPDGSVHGLRRIRLVADLDMDHTIKTILTDDNTGASRYGGDPSSLRRVGEPLSGVELENLARRAR